MKVFQEEGLYIQHDFDESSLGKKTFNPELVWLNFSSLSKKRLRFESKKRLRPYQKKFRKETSSWSKRDFVLIKKETSIKKRLRKETKSLRISKADT